MALAGSSLAWRLAPAALAALGAAGYLLGNVPTAELAAAVLFELLAGDRWGEGARWGALWLGLGAAATLFVGRLPFLLGVALGLGALLALQRERRATAVALALACPLASPVAALFLALAGV